MAFLGDESQWAAEAAECAGDQASFWAYHDKLFASQSGENQGAFSKDKLKGFAADLKLDTAAFNTCLDSGKYTQVVQAETAAAQALGAQSTPSFFINDWLVLGALPIERFDGYIEKAKQGIHPSPTATPLPTGKLFYDADPNRAGRTYDGSPMLGSADAPLLLIHFDDLKSADAAKYAADAEPQLIEKYVTPGKLRVVYKMFPTDGPKAALAGVCAAEQDKFWEFRALLLTKQADWTDGDNAKMTEYAKSLGLDEAKFTACLTDLATQYEVEAATQFGQDVGVPSVPAFLIIDLNLGQAVNNVLGAQPFSEFDAKLQAALATPTPAASAATPTPAPTK